MIDSKHLQVLVVLLGSILAIYVGSNIVALSPSFLFITLAAVGLLAWLFLAGINWWVPIFTGGAIGGVFFLGVKIYPAEAASILAIVGLLPLVLVQDRKVFEAQRRPLPFIFYLTGLYLGIRLLVCILPAASSKGQLSRILLSFVWPFIFCFLFHHYGSFSAARTAMKLMFFLLLVRIVAALIGFVFGIPLIIPGINYVLSFSSADSLLSMRVVAYTLLVTAMVFFHASKSFLVRSLLVLVFCCAMVLVFMGAGRFQTFVTLLLPLIFFAWSRKWGMLLAAVVVSFCSIAFINVVPSALNVLPPSAGRALSGLVFTRNVSQNNFATELSDQWHATLRTEGYRRLMQNPATFLFGDGISPSPVYADTMAADKDSRLFLESAANVGAFENGFWTVLSLTGSVGFVLYTLLFIKLWEETFPYFVRRPRGTFWEGFLFWGIFSSVIWYVVCYFQGGAPSLELILMVMAWEMIGEGKMDEEPAETERQQGYPGSYAFPQTLPVQSRG